MAGLVGLQARSLRRDSRERRLSARGWCVRGHALGLEHLRAATEHRGREVDGGRRAGGHPDRARARDRMGHAQPGAHARAGRSHRHARAGQARRRRHLVGRSVQHLQPRRPGLRRRRTRLRPQRPRAATRVGLRARTAERRAPRRRTRHESRCRQARACGAGARAPVPSFAVADAQAPATAIVHAKLYTMESVQPIEDATIVMREGVVQSVGASLAPPAGARSSMRADTSSRPG